MTKKEKIKQAANMLKFILTVEDEEIKLSTIEAVIEMLDELSK